MCTVDSAEPNTVSGARRLVVLWLRWAPIGWWVLSAATALVVGERPSSLPALLAAVDAGQVSEVQVVGALPPGHEGFVTQDVRWRQDGLSRYSEVRDASPGYTQDQGARQGHHLDRRRDGHSPTQPRCTGAGVNDGLVVHDVRNLELAGAAMAGRIRFGRRAVLPPGSRRRPRAMASDAMGLCLGGAPRRPCGHVAFAMLSGPTLLVPSPRGNDDELVVAHVRGGPRRQPKRGSRQAGSQGPDTWRQAW